MALLSFLAQAVGVSLSGVMAPGPATAATIMAGMQRKHAGLMIALGHAVVEVPLMLLVMWSVTLLESDWFSITVGLIGGACLLYMGGAMLAAMRKPIAQGGATAARGPFLTGIVVTGGNPYFLLWWPTVGLTLCTRAIEFGPAAFALFAFVHWLCDLIWMEVLSVTSFTGSKWLGPKRQKYILAVCGVALMLFGLKFAAEAAWKIFAGSGA